ncbi:hypothetical protein BO85DRAFT_110487 [Aspergillus piperis CBS 112811]|uniref:Uncharacterized protein n=1 Tax=Aspergillus piperis CBS 112811 TaxID=1448313 RepID=A0A8G1RBC1_9EURO|nr:hypothetical protein BO85DRAFT_110487 [Aspergillus piperis CBS 112811]RAH61604.1 hypothetical protein BO85DRAFT_110487 [Aspergillus piperis CBS 112811]
MESEHTSTITIRLRIMDKARIAWAWRESERDTPPPPTEERILLLRVIHPVARCNPRPKRLSTHSRSAAAGVTERPGHPPSNCGEQQLGLGTFFILPVHPFDRSRPQQPRKFKMV